MLGLQDRQWQGQTAYVVGGGPSLKSFDWNLLRRRPNIIAVNRAILNCPWADIWFSEDYRVVELWHDKPEWREFKGVKILHLLDESYRKVVTKYDTSIQFLGRRRESRLWTKSLKDGICQSSNSLAGALNLADILGVSRIYILGLDCNIHNEKEKNYHADYEKAGFDRTGDHQYRSFKSDFEHWVFPNTRHIEIFNLNIYSAVECWPMLERDAYFARTDIQYTHHLDTP